MRKNPHGFAKWMVDQVLKNTPVISYQRVVPSLLGSLALYVVLGFCAFASAAALLEAEARRPGEDPAPVAIEPGMTLRTGDAVRFRIRSQSDAYVYLIAIGSSGTARVLQPFSGKPADAWMGAGELRKIPGDGDFLPLDKRAGNEVVLAVSATAPIPNLTRLLVHLEDAAPDSVALVEVLRRAGLEAGVLGFDHAAAQAPGSASAAAPVAENSSPAPGSAAPAAQAAEAGSGSEQGEVVLGGLGSRISAFQSNQALPPQPGGDSLAANTEINPFQVQPDAGTATADGAAESADSAAKESGIGKTLANWFGLESKPDPQAQAPEPAATAAADTFPLQVQAPPPAPRVLPEPRTQAPAAAPEAALVQPPSPPAGKPRVTLVEPLAVEKSLQRSAGQAPPATAAAGADTAAMEIPENGRTAGVLASLFGPAPTSETPPPDPGAESAAPMPILLELEEEKPSAAQAESEGVAAGATGEPAAAALPATASEPPPESPSPESTPAEGGGLLGWLTGSSAESGDSAAATEPHAQPGAEAQAPSLSEPKAQATAAAAGQSEPEVPFTVAAEMQSESKAAEAAPETGTDSSDSGGGLLGWLTGGSSESAKTATASETQVQTEAEPGAPAQPGPQAPATAAAEVQSEPEATDAAPDAGTESSGPGSGLLGWLTGGSSESAKTATASEPQAQPESEPEAPAQPAPDAPVTAAAGGQSEPEATDTAADTDTESTDSGGGLLGWLTGGGSTQEADTQEADTQEADTQETAAAPAADPATEQTGTPSQATQGTGILAGLGALFGGGRDAEPAAAGTDGTVEPAAAGTPLVRTEAVDPKAPAMTRHKNAQGQNVVVLSGPEVPPAQAPAVAGAAENTQVLSGQGSRIQALLEPETRPQAPEPQQPETQGLTPATSRETSSQTVPSAASLPPPASEAVDSAAAVSTPPAPEPPLQLNPEESQGNVTRLALNAAPAQAVKQAAVASGSLDLSDDQGLAGAVVLVVSAAGNGAGVVINKAGQVLTNWHLVRDLDRVSVAYKQPGAARIEVSSLYPARVIQHSKYPDLALLEVLGGVPAAASAKLAAAAGPARGKRLHTLHLADTGAWEPALATVARVRSGSSWYSGRRILHRGTVIRAQLQDRPGLSGVPLFNEYGEIAGLTTLVKPGKNQLVAVSAQTLRAFLQPAQ